MLTCSHFFIKFRVKVLNEEDKEEFPKSIEDNKKNEINQEKLDSENKNLSNKENSNN